MTYQVIRKRRELHAGAFLDDRPTTASQIEDTITTTVQPQLPTGDDEDAGGHPHNQGCAVDRP